jgi:lysophospholipase L1-like esterase
MLENYVKYIFLMLAAIVCIWVVGASLRFFVSVRKAGDIIAQTRPYTAEGSGPKILVLGDSIAYGTGASIPDKSLAAVVASNYPGASVDNQARNGKRAYQLADEIGSVTGHYDLILVVVGGNDIMRPQIDLSRSAASLTAVYEHCSRHADQVIALTTGNFRYTTIFLPPLNLYYEGRSKYLRDSAKEAAATLPNVTYVDLIAFNEKVTFSKDMEAADNLHLSDKGIQYWAEAIKQSTRNYSF